MTHCLRQDEPANNGATEKKSLSRLSRPLILGVVASLLKAGLGILFLYLGTIKLLGRDEAARLAAMGVGRYLRDTVGGLELAVGALLLARSSGYLFHSLVVAVSLVEVGLLHRAPLAAVGCLAAHGVSTWARSVHDHARMVSPYPSRYARAVRTRHALHTFRTRAIVVRPKPSATGRHTAHPLSCPGPERRSDTH